MNPNIDIDLLRRQRDFLLSISNTGKRSGLLSDFEQELVDGLTNLLDHLLDNEEGFTQEKYWFRPTIYRTASIKVKESLLDRMEENLPCLQKGLGSIIVDVEELADPAVDKSFMQCAETIPAILQFAKAENISEIQFYC